MKKYWPMLGIFVIPIYVLFFLFFSCSQNCNNLPDKFDNYNQARSLVLDSYFKIIDEADVSNSSFIKSAGYYSCDGLVGYLVIGTHDTDYIFQYIPYPVWTQFKNANSKGRFFNMKIKGRYKLKLNY